MQRSTAVSTIMEYPHTITEDAEDSTPPVQWEETDKKLFRGEEDKLTQSNINVGPTNIPFTRSLCTEDNKACTQHLVLPPPPNPQTNRLTEITVNGVKLSEVQKSESPLN